MRIPPAAGTPPKKPGPDAVMTFAPGTDLFNPYRAAFFSARTLSFFSQVKSVSSRPK